MSKFDRELVQGHHPRIERILSEVAEANRDALFGELLAVELEYRTQRRDKPKPEEYIRRFPHLENAIVGAFALLSETFVPSQETVSVPVDAPPAPDNFRLIKEIGRGGWG